MTDPMDIKQINSMNNLMPKFNNPDEMDQILEGYKLLTLAQETDSRPTSIERNEISK